MAQSQAVLAQLRLQTRSGRTALYASGKRDRIDLDHPVHPFAIEAHHTGVIGMFGQPRLYPAHNARAATEGDDRCVRILRPGEHGVDLLGGAGPGDQIGWVRQISADGPDYVPVGPADRMRGAVIGRVREEISKRWSGFESRRGKVEVCEIDRLDHTGGLEPEALGNALGDQVEASAVGLLIGVAPAPPLELALIALLGHVGEPTRCYQ